jgi:hypothetical protein
MPETSDLCAIVVVGTMDPRIHHPSWYEIEKVLTAEEAKEALTSGELVCAPILARFRTARFTIVCQQDRWEIQTTAPEALERLLEIAVRLFDGVLPSTPVAAFGLNFVFHRETGVPDVGASLASAVASLPLGLTPAEKATAQLTRTTTFPERTIQESISVPPGAATMVLVAYNFHYPISEKGKFDLGPRMRVRWQEDHQEALSRAERLASALGRSVEEEADARTHSRD